MLMGINLIVAIFLFHCAFFASILSFIMSSVSLYILIDAIYNKKITNTNDGDVYFSTSPIRYVTILIAFGLGFIICLIVPYLAAQSSPAHQAGEITGKK